MKYMGETKENGAALCFFAAHYSPPPSHCYNAIATKRATIKSSDGKVLEKDLPLCGGCAKAVAECERDQGHTVIIQRLDHTVGGTSNT